MVNGNNVIANVHCRKPKTWQKLVKPWFNQPGRKMRRRAARQAKAERIFPRPLDSLRPEVHCQTVKYNTKVREGRGFTLNELKEARIPRKRAPTIGIAVDHRRKNRCTESLAANVARLKAYKSKLVLFPRRTKASKKTGVEGLVEADKAARAAATQLKGDLMKVRTKKPTVATAAVNKNAPKAYAQIRTERMNLRMVGIRKKRAEEAAAEAKQKTALKG